MRHDQLDDLVEEITNCCLYEIRVNIQESADNFLGEICATGPSSYLRFEHVITDDGEVDSLLLVLFDPRIASLRLSPTIQKQDSHWLWTRLTCHRHTYGVDPRA